MRGGVYIDEKLSKYDRKNVIVAPVVENGAGAARQKSYFWESLKMRSSETEVNGTQDNTRKQSEIFSTRASAHTHRTAPRTHRSAASTARISKPLVAFAFVLLTVMLSVSFIGMSSPVLVTAAGDVTFNNIVNANIGMHPKWIQDSCDSVEEGGVGDSYTVKHTVWHVDVDDNDPIMEKSPAYTFKGNEKVSDEFADRYNLQRGNEVVFNIEDPDTAAKVWADAVAFAQTLGTPTPLADSILAGTTPESACKGGGTENHRGFRVGTNTDERNMYKGNFFIENDDGALGQYITVRLQTDWVAKAITANVPNGDPTKVNPTTSDYVTLTGAPTSVSSTTFNYILTTKQDSNDGYLTADKIDVFNCTQDAGGYTLSYDIASNSFNYDANSAPVFNDNCAFSYGRINVPTGVYIVLDLNGHTIDRALTGYNKVSTTNGDMFGSVIHINSKARLEICDTSAYENASSSRVQRYEKVTENSADAVAVEGYGSKKIWKLVDAETLIPFNTLNPTNNQYKDYIVVTNHKGTITGGYNSGTADRKGSYGAGLLNVALQPEMQHRGGAVNLSPWADLVMHSGTIYGNKTPSETGGAFYQRSKAAVTIFDGYVIQNVANAGGVSSLGGGSGCPFTMYGGVLGYNTVNGNGGALALGVCSYANFHGGEIVYNHAGGTGGALNLSGNTLGILDSVTITGNTSTGNGGGVYVPIQVAAVDELKRVPNGQGRAFKFRGSLQIYGNKHGEENEENVYLASGTSPSDFDMSGAGGGIKPGAYTGQPVIAIGGPMFANGIVARVGVTLGNASTVSTGITSPNTQNCSIFTADYGKYNSGVNAFNYFFSDKKTYDSSHGNLTSARVVNSVASAGSADNEGKIGNDTTAEQTITWVIKGTGVTSTENEHAYTITAQSNSVTTDTAGGISYTYEGLTCEFGMLKVTSVEAHTDGASGTLVAKWEITSSGSDIYNIVNTFTETNFRFKLGDWDYVDGKSAVADSAGRKGTTATHAAIHATDNTISYAGEYSFLVSTEGKRYVNPSFKIRINQVGVEVDRELYYKGQDVKELKWTKNINWDGSTDDQGSPTIGGKGSPQAQLGDEENQPYFIYSGDYYYPILNADWDRATVLSLYNPYTGNTSSVAKKDFTGYVMKFTYANSTYFGSGKAVEFGEHSGGGVEYQTMHRKPGEIAGIGTYVPGVMHAGMYQVSFISSRSAASADAASQDYKNTGVYFAANNFAFSSKINLYVEPASAEVQLTPDAINGFTYKGSSFTDSEILLFDNTSDTSVVPHTDSTATMAYYLFDALKFKAGIYDVRTDLFYTFDQVKDKDAWNAIRPLGKGETAIPGRPQFDQYTKEDFENKPPTVTFTGDSNTNFEPSANMKFVGEDGNIPQDQMKAFEEEYQKETVADSTGRLVYIIDTSSFNEAKKYKQGEVDPLDRSKGSNPLDARRYVVLIELALEGGYDDYDYIFDQDSNHLVGLKGESQYFWAFEFVVNPAEINPYENTTTAGSNTPVSITKDVYYKNISYGYEYKDGKFTDEDGVTHKRLISDTANLPTVTFNGGASSVALALGGDYDVEFVEFDEVNNPSEKKYNFLDASVGLDKDSSAPEVDGFKFGDYNLAVKITFGGTNQNYVNTTETAGKADDKGTAYEDKDGAFYIYFRIIPVIVTASANISYTYDGGSYDRGRHLAASGDYSEWYESIFFLAQDSITTSQELIENQKQNIDTWESADKSRKLKDLWGGVHGKRPEDTGDNNTYTDKEFYQQRYYISNVNVQYTNNDFIANGIKLGVGMYSFQTNSPNYQVASYHLTTVDYDNENNIETAPKNPGVMWLLTVGNTQSFVSTQQDKTAATNFIVSAASYLDVNINQKDITANDVKVTLNGKDYDGAAEFPYSGHEYRPKVELSYTVQVPTQAAGAHATKSVTINTISIKSDGNVEADSAYDSFITYSNNVQTSTDVLPASVMITAASNSKSTSAFSQNFYNVRSLEFKITPASVKVTIKDGARIFPYDRTEHPVTLEYTNTTDYSKFKDLLPADFGTDDNPKPLPLEQTEINIMYGEVGADNTVPEGAGGIRNFVSTAPTNAGRYRVAVHLNSTNFIYVADDYSENTDQFVRDSGDSSKDILTYNNSATSGKDTDLIINPAVAYIGPGAQVTTPDGHEIVNQFTYNRNIQVPSVLSTNICNVSLAGEKWNANYESSVVPASSSGDYKIQYAKDQDGSPNTDALSSDGFADAGTYWMILDMVSENFIWGGYKKDDPLFTHEELSDKRLAVKYTILPSQVLLKPADSISGATYPDGQGTLHFTYDGVKHEVGVNVSSTTLPPLSTEYKLNKVGFVGVKPSFAETTEEKNYLSIYAGTYSFTVTFTDAAKKNYVWSSLQEAWENYNSAHKNSVIVDEAGTGSNTGNKIVYVDIKNNTVTITYIIDPAEVYIESITSEQFNRQTHDNPQINFKNSADTNSQVPTPPYDISFKVSDAGNQWLHQSDAKTVNAKLGAGDKPLNAGNYDVTVTLTGDDKNNFKLVQQPEYKSSLNSDKEETVTYSGVSADKTTAVALFVIEQLGVYANQVVSSVIFDNKDHFNGNPYGLTSGGLYGGNGPWTIRFSSSSGMIQLDGISYNIYFKGKANDGNWYIVKVKIGGYQADATTRNEDKFYLQKLSGEEDDGTSGKAEVSSFEKISALGLFTNAAEYTYKLYFQDANLFISAIEGATAEKEFTYTITAATIALGTLANKTFNNHEQEPVFDDNSFTAVGDTTFEAGTKIFDILNEYNMVEEGSGYTVSYTLPAPIGNSRFGDTDKPFNAGSYTVTVTLASENFTFSGSETSTMTFTIDPFDISLLNAEQFKVTLPDVIYTGTAMNTVISHVEVKIGEETVTLVSSGATDGQLQLGENGYNISIASCDNNVNVSTDKATAHIVGSNNFAGELTRKFAILPRPVTVTVYGQSGVYGAGQHLSIGATEYTHWRAEQGEIGKGEEKGVVNNDSLGIRITIIQASGWNETSSQLNVGWYSVRVSYTNANYTVTFKGDNNSLSSYGGYEANAEEEPQTASEEISGDEVAAYDIVNSYYVYKRVISLYVSAQSVTYNGQAPVIQQGNPTYWNVVSVVNGEGSALVSGDEDAFNAAVELYVVAPEDGDDMYDVWKKWGMWSAGSYSDNSGIKARFKEAGADETILQNYEIQEATCAILRIAPAEITVTHNEQSSTYNNDAPTISQTRDSYEITGNTFNSRRWNGNAFDEEPIPNDNAENNLLKFKFTYDDGDSKPTEDYGAGRHLIRGAWDGDPNPNFNVIFNAGVYTINKRDLVITILDQYVIYGEKLLSADDDWWIENNETKYGTLKLNPKYWTVEVKNYNKDYPGGDKIYWVNEEDREDLKIAPVIEAQIGANAGTYAISGSWNSSNDDYNVTFVGSWNATNPEKTNGTGGTYTIHKRAIIVHINDQGGVYGGSSFGTAVDQSMGNDAEHGGWYVVGFDSDKQKDICEGHECGTPTEPVVVASDNLNIVLTLGDVSAPGEYDIVGSCGNDNYAVTWKGNRIKDGVAVGKFGITAREVTVNVSDQTVEYGKGKDGVPADFEQNRYSATANNDSTNRVGFIKADNVVVELSVTVLHSGTGDYNQAGKYAITVRIYEGYTSSSDKGKLIYSSNNGDSVTQSDKYVITVKGNFTDAAINGETGTYEITKKDLIITVADKSSIYGESLEKLTFTTNGAMEDEKTEIEKKIALAIADPNYNEWDKDSRYLCAGSYNITATLDDETINNNYNIVFRTQNGADYKTDDGEKITAMYTVTKRMLAINVTYLNSVYGEELQRFTATLSPVGAITGEPILAGDSTASGDRPLGIKFEIVGENSPANLSTTGHLKVGIYPIIGSWESETYSNYDVQFTGVWSNDNTNTWLKQATGNASVYMNSAGAHATLDRKAGVYTVSKRPINVTLGTTTEGEHMPQSEYGDDIVDFAGDINQGKSWGVRYEESTTGRGRVSAEGGKIDDIVFEMTTTAYRGASATTYPITVKEGSDVGGDNNNYDIEFKQGTYTIKPREMTVKLTAKEPKVEEGSNSCATDVYGTTYDQEAKFEYTFRRANPKDGDTGFYNGEKIALVITPWKDASAQDAKLTETGYYPVGVYSLALSAKNDPNYSFTSMEGSNVRYKVTPRPITIHINDQHSVYGEDVYVCQDEYKDDDTLWGWKVVSKIGIVTGNGTRDELGLEITRADATNINFKEGGYELKATISNRNYKVTWVGGAKAEGVSLFATYAGEGLDNYTRDHGVYMIDKRLIHIRIFNQYSIYGENIDVKSELTSYEVVTPGDGADFYSLMPGESPYITLNIFTTEGETVIWYSKDGSTTFSGTIGRGEYHIGVQTIGNDNYAVEVDAKYLPDVNDKSKEQERKNLVTEFPDDFGETTTLKTIEVKNPVISDQLANSKNATYFVTIRPVTIKINDQSGTYGDYLTLNSSGEGASPAYTVDLGKYLGSYVTTGQPFVGGYKATFDLVTTAIEGSDTSGSSPKGKTMGWSLNAGTYPIFGAAYHVFMNDAPIEDESDDAARLSHNYQFNFEGSYDIDDKYPSGTTFQNRAGVYTVEKRQVSLTAKDSSATYGGTGDKFISIPTPDNDNYQAIVSNSKVNTYGIETRGPILADDVDSLAINIAIQYNNANLSHAKALKVGEYTLKLTFKQNDNYDITAVNGNFEVTVRQASILIAQSAAKATYLATIPTGWSEKDAGMYTLSNALPGDVIAFTMTTKAERGNAVGQYALNGTIGGASADNDNANYSVTFTDGTFEITKKQVFVTINDHSSEYGEMPSVNDSAKWSLREGWNKDGDFTKNDSPDALGINLSTSANAETNVGTYQISGQYDISSDVGKNYDLHFVGSWNASAGMTNGNGGTLTIYKRSIVVVIKPQAITYRDNIAIDNYGWFAWRNGNTATWKEDGTTNNEGGVLGPKDGLDALNVFLTKGEATDTATYGYNTGSGTYFGTYALVGSHTATNYDITFAYERAEKDFNYLNVKENEDGTFDIKPYEITINILTLGRDNDVKYGEYKFGAELTNAQDIIWDYAYSERQFLPAEVTYLSFSLGGKNIAEEAGDVYAFVGAHPIVGYWGKNLTDMNATDYRMQYNYKVTFKGNWNSENNSPGSYGYDSLYANGGETTYGSCGVINIANADIVCGTYDQSYQQGEANGSHWHGDNWNRYAAFTGNGPTNPWHSMEIGANDLAFAGNVLFGGYDATHQFGGHDNTQLVQHATVEYSLLKRNSAYDDTLDWTEGEKAPAVQDVGVWTVEVTVKAPYHNTFTYTLTLTVSQLDITVYLTGAKVSFEYGVYRLLGDDVLPVDGEDSFSETLKRIIFDEQKVTYLDKIDGAEGLGDEDDAINYLRHNSEIVLDIVTRGTDASTGGYLKVNEYELTISAGVNMSIRFGEKYYIAVEKRDLEATWQDPNDVHKLPEKHEDTHDKYVYTFDGKDISVVPYVKEGVIMNGDLVLKDAHGANVFDFVIYRFENGAYSQISDTTVRNVGTYKVMIRENNSPTSDSNVDIGNYNTPQDWVYIVIQPAELTIVIENQSSEYDGNTPTLDQEANKAWHIKPSVVGGAYPDVVPGTGEALSSLGISLSFASKDPVDADSYGIVGSYSTSNYTILFEGTFGDGTQGAYTIYQRNVKIKVSNFSFTYGDDIPGNLASDTNKYKAVHIVGGEERTSDIAVLPSDDIKLEFSISGPLPTETGYIKVGEYNVKMSYDNDNYSITFADEAGNLQNTGDYSQVKATIEKRTLFVNIYDRPVEYGTLRSEIVENYKFDGWASKDGEKYGDKAPNFITFECYDAMTKSPLRADKDFDAVGVYIIIGKVAKDDIGDNYDVNFSGEWKGEGEYTGEEYVGKAGKYEVTPRKISIVIGNVSSQYGDALTDEDILDTVTLQEGANNKLAPDDKIQDLRIKFKTEAVRIADGQRRTNNASNAPYEITIEDVENKNYEILSYVKGYYTVTRREIVITLKDTAHPYGDDHAAHVEGFGFGNGWTAERYGDLSGDGIAYPDDAIIAQVKLGTSANERSAAGEYELYISVNPSDTNYDVKNISTVKGKYTVTKRKVILKISTQSSEYGENHVLAKSFEFVLNETGSNRPEKAVAFDTDAINQLELRFTDDISVRTAAGDYRINASFTDNNYDVTISGEYIDGDRQYGKYVVTKRDIVIKLLGTQQSEYGDPVFANSDETKGWIADRPAGKGGNAFVNGDTFELELAVLDSLGREVDSTFSVGKYAVIVKQVISKEVSVNYNISYVAQDGQAFEDNVSGHADEAAAVYNIVPRKITVKFGGESEYGDPIKVNDMSYRTGGKEGFAIVNGDNLGYAFEWGAQDDPTNGGSKLADVGQYALKLRTSTDSDAQKVCANYEITPDENSFYHVVPRKITVHVGDITKTYGDEFEDPDNIREALLEVSRTTAGATGNAILNNDIQFFRLSVINGDNILLTDGRPVHAGVYNYRLTYTDNNRNYEIIVDYGHYTIVPKPITVTIDSKTSKYSEDIVELTHGEVKGLIGDDDLYITLSVLWLDEEQGLEWHNAGVYAIQGVYDNPDYAVTFKGDMGAYGKYTIEKAENRFVKEYNGNGTVYIGDNFRDGDLPTALWGNDSLYLEFYLDAEMNHKADFTDILDATAGTYYVKVIVDENINWKGATTSFALNIVDGMTFSDGMDVTAYVCVFASQFIILACALIFIRRKKDKKIKKYNKGR